MTDEKKKDIAYSPLPVSPDPFAQAADMKKGLEAMKQNMQMMLELQEVRAKINRATYVTMVAEGFSPAEALAFILQKGV